MLFVGPVKMFQSVFFGACAGVLYNQTQSKFSHYKRIRCMAIYRDMKERDRVLKAGLEELIEKMELSKVPTQNFIKLRG